MTTPDTCHGCMHSTKRLKWSKLRTWCQRYRQARDIRCIDYRSKRAAITIALDYLKRTSIK